MLDRKKSNEILVRGGIQAKFLDEENGVFIYSGEVIESWPFRTGLYYCVNSYKDKSIVMTYNTDNDDVRVALMFNDTGKRLFDSDFTSSFFNKGALRIHSKESSAEELARKNKHYCRSNRDDCYECIDVKRSLQEMIEDFDTDIEGVESVEMDSRTEKYMHEKLTLEGYDKYDILDSSDCDPVITSKIYDILAKGKADEELAMPYVIRALKSFKTVLDRHEIHYNDAWKLGSLIEWIQTKLEEEGTDFDYFCNGRSFPDSKEPKVLKRFKYEGPKKPKQKRHMSLEEQLEQILDSSEDQDDEERDD